MFLKKCFKKSIKMVAFHSLACSSMFLRILVNKMLMTVPFPLWNPVRSFPRFHLHSVDEDSDVYFSG